MNQEININNIMSLIPHRYPFLLVDKIIKIDNKSIVGLKNVTSNEPQFMGHFPNNPVMPGVLIIESMAQISALLATQSMSSVKNKEIFFVSIDNAKFRKVVKPGDSLTIYSTLIQNRGSVWKFSVTAKVHEDLVAEANLLAMVKTKT